MNNRNKIVIILLFLVCIFSGVYTLDKFGIKLFCPIHKYTGYYCPGCGITRAITSLYKLDLYQAFRYNPLVFILFIIFIVYILLKPLLNINISKKLLNNFWISLALVVFLYGVIRNIPIFSFLAPTNI